MGTVHPFFQNLREITTPTPLSIDCLPGVEFDIVPVTPKRREKIREQATKRGRFKADKYNASIIGAAVKGWRGLTQGKYVRILGGYEITTPIVEDEEIPYSPANLLEVCARSNQFVQEMLILLGEDESVNEEIAEARREKELEKN